MTDGFILYCCLLSQAWIKLILQFLNHTLNQQNMFWWKQWKLVKFIRQFLEPNLQKEPNLWLLNAYKSSKYYKYVSLTFTTYNTRSVLVSLHTTLYCVQITMFIYIDRWGNRTSSRHCQQFATKLTAMSKLLLHTQIVKSAQCVEFTLPSLGHLANALTTFSQYMVLTTLTNSNSLWFGDRMDSRLHILWWKLFTASWDLSTQRWLELNNLSLPFCHFLLVSVLCCPFYHPTKNAWQVLSSLLASGVFIPSVTALK